jgi:hypothetical protein
MDMVDLHFIESFMKCMEKTEDHSIERPAFYFRMHMQGTEIFAKLKNENAVKISVNKQIKLNEWMLNNMEKYCGIFTSKTFRWIFMNKHRFPKPNISLKIIYPV